MNKTNYTIRRIVAPLRCLLELEAFQHLYNPLCPSVCSFVRPSVPPETYRDRRHGCRNHRRHHLNSINVVPPRY